MQGGRGGGGEREGSGEGQLSGMSQIAAVKGKEKRRTNCPEYEQLIWKLTRGEIQRKIEQKEAKKK